jgi:hypothetical protein
VNPEIVELLARIQPAIPAKPAASKGFRALFARMRERLHRHPKEAGEPLPAEGEAPAAPEQVEPSFAAEAKKSSADADLQPPASEGAKGNHSHRASHGSAEPEHAETHDVEFGAASGAEIASGKNGGAAEGPASNGTGHADTPDEKTESKPHDPR